MSLRSPFLLFFLLEESFFLSPEFCWFDWASPLCVDWEELASDAVDVAHFGISLICRGAVAGGGPSGCDPLLVFAPEALLPDEVLSPDVALALPEALSGVFVPSELAGGG